jgi:mannose-6-phosphate isomerase-like protein (cupin superfamily)
MTPEEIAALRRWSPAEMAQRIVRHADLAWSTHGFLDSALPGGGAQLAPVIGLGISQDRNALAPVANAHGLSIEWLRIPPGGQVSRHRLREKQVLIAKAGVLELAVETTAGERSHRLHGEAAAWDSFAVPAEVWRTLRNPGATEARALVLTAGDQRKRIEWDAGVVESAARQDLAIDANGYVAPKRFVERAQR